MEGRKTEEVREQDRFLPIANISRIMKKSLPNNAKIAKDAKETVQECVSEFISFITSEGTRRFSFAPLYSKLPRCGACAFATADHLRDQPYPCSE